MTADLRGGRGVLFLAALASFTAFVDTAIVNLALPQIGRAFDTDASQLAWVVTAYVLPFAVSILAVGKLGDGFGRQRVLVGGSILFAVGCAGAALAPSFLVLLLMRAVQGLGASALLTLSLAIVSATFEGPARARALGIYFAASAIGGTVGPVVGGVLTTAFDWPAMFVVQVPLGILVAVVARAVLVDRPGPSRSLDPLGLALGTLVLVGVNVALLQADDWGWTSPAIAAAWLLAGLALIGFVARERAAREPAVDLAVFRNRRFVGASLVGAAMWFAIVSGSVLLAIYLQAGRGLTTAEAALVLLSWPLTSLVVFPRAGSIALRFGVERVMLGSTVAVAVLAAAMATFGAATPYVVVALIGAASGVVVPLAVAASAVGAVAEFEAARAGIASGIFNSIRQVGSSLGVAIPAAVFDAVAGGSLAADATLAGAGPAFLSRSVAIGLAALAAAWILTRAGRPSPQPAPAPG